MNLWEMHAYVFTWHKGDSDCPTYERTFPAACLSDALKWIRKSGRRGFVSINCLPRRYWY